MNGRLSRQLMVLIVMFGGVGGGLVLSDAVSIV